MKYVALLRGINVGGNSVIRMADLKSAVEKCGYTNVSTFIASGNVIFESNESDTDKIARQLEKCLEQNFHVASVVIIKTKDQFKKIVAEVPADWNTRKDIRKYISFIREPVTSRDVMREIEPRACIDFAEAGDGVIYMSTLLSGLTKSGFTKLIGKSVYKHVTMRNYNSVQRIMAMLDKS